MLSSLVKCSRMVSSQVASKAYTHVFNSTPRSNLRLISNFANTARDQSIKNDLIFLSKPANASLNSMSLTHVNKNLTPSNFPSILFQGITLVNQHKNTQLVAKFLDSCSIQPNSQNIRMEVTSVRRKRRLKMNKHKYRKLRKRTRALRKRLGK
ncbi:mitochondrial 37S ribosomal protein mS38 [Calcarisporiella thermophila]|uniref:mitochondrial 37S ribosomal protein mS38 n=1 Tax=Calcarisporiella thermophila TaxID=911321 RepID=UPI003743BA6B